MPQEDLYDLIEERPLSAILPQRNNLNQHTQRGMGMLENSIQSVGWIGAGTMAANGEIFDGTARHEKADLLGQDALIVKTDGRRPVYVMRTDIPTADDPRAIEAGLRANRVAQVNLSWDAEALIELNDEGLIDIDEFWLPHEQEMLLVDAEDGDRTLDERDTPQMADTGGKVPLAIVLEPHEKDAWDQAKDQLGYASDGKAFRAMWEQWREGSIRE